MRSLGVTVRAVIAGLVLCCSTVAAQTVASKPGIEGTWQGSLHMPDATLRIVLKIERVATGSEALSATMYSIDQGGQPLAASAVSFEGGILRFEIRLSGLAYEGRMSADGNSISGTMQQNGAFSLVLERATPETEWTIPAQPKVPAMAADAKPGVEVATIRPTAPDAPRTVMTFRGSEIVISRMTLSDLIESVYQLHEKQIVNGPAWMGTEKFDVNVRPDQPGTPNREQFRMILKTLLATRFALRFHDEQKEMAAYALTVGKDGPKMARSVEASDLGGISVGPLGLMRARNSTMGEFAARLQAVVLDRPVVDRTGLEGRWEFVLKWMPDDSQFGGQLQLPAPTGNAEALPPLFTAIIEQLGLKLDAERTAVSVMVIDHVDHPSPN